MRYASRADHRAEVSPTEEYLSEALTPTSSTDELDVLQAVPGSAPCAWCGRDERSHTPRQLFGCRERLDDRAGRRP